MSASACQAPTIVSRAKAGFTLMEILVVMTIVGLMMPLLYANIRAGVTAWAQGQAHVSHAHKIQNVQTWLRKQLGQAYPKFIVSPDMAGHVDFDGQASSLQFISPLPEALGGGGWAKTTLLISEGDGGLQLTVSQRPELAWDEVPEAPQTRLIGNLKSASFSYFGGDNQWHDHWQNEKAFPRLIKMRVEFADSKLIWPEFSVVPQITADVGCIYDPLTKYCQGR